MSGNETPKKDTNAELETSIKEQTQERLELIDSLVQEVGGENAHIDDVLPTPPEVRNDAPMPNWTPEQEAKAREVGKQFGYGAEQDVQSGLSDVVSIAEGGKVWKILAEAEAIRAEDTSRVIFAGSAYRKLGEDELTFLKDKHGLSLPPETTEYDAARWVAEKQLTEKAEPVSLPFGYDVAEGNPLVQETTRQLVKLGQTTDGRSIELLRVDREVYTAEDGSQKYRFQPDNSRLMDFISEVLTLEGDNTAPVVFATSNTYASRQVNAMRAGLNKGRRFGVNMYGRQTIKDLNASVPPETPLNHLPGDLRIMHDSLEKLLTELS